MIILLDQMLVKAFAVRFGYRFDPKPYRAIKIFALLRGVGHLRGASVCAAFWGGRLKKDWKMPGQGIDMLVKMTSSNSTTSAAMQCSNEASRMNEVSQWQCGDRLTRSQDLDRISSTCQPLSTLYSIFSGTNTACGVIDAHCCKKSHCLGRSGAAKSLPQFKQLPKLECGFLGNIGWNSLGVLQ